MNFKQRVKILQEYDSFRASVGKERGQEVPDSGAFMLLFLEKAEYLRKPLCEKGMMQAAQSE